MAQVTQTNNGFKLSDSHKLKGNELNCEFSYEMTGEVGCDSKAAYFEKLRAYFAQEAAGKWNKAKVKAEKKMESKLAAAEKDLKKFVKDVRKYNIKDPAKTIQEEEAKYSIRLSDEMGSIITKDIGPTFMQDSHAAAEKRLMKEGTKLKRSKAKIAFKIGKVFVKIAAVVAAAIATAATGGAAAPLLVVVAGWVAFSFKAVKSIFEGSKIISKLAIEAKADVKQMEKKLAELDKMFESTVKFANNLESKADSMEMQADKMKVAMNETMEALSKVNSNSKEYASKAKDLENQVKQIDSMMRDFGGMRCYAPKMRDAFNEFRKVKNEASWGTNIANGKKAASALNDLGKAFEAFVKMVEKT